MARGTGRRGTTLAELLVAIAFIGVCAGAILACVTSSSTRSTHAKRRAIVLAQLQSEIEQVRSTAKSSSLTTGTVNTTPAMSGFTGTANMSRSITLVSGYTNLYRVLVQMNWTEQTSSGQRSETLLLETNVRAPDA